MTTASAGQRYPHHRSGGQAGGAELELRRRVRIGGMAKGSGMIHPDMATMLGFFSCDAGLEATSAGEEKRAVRRSFNAITVDGDTSTNDTVPFAQVQHRTKSTMPFWNRA